MRVICIYSVTDFVSAVKPLVNQACISMGIASVATALARAGHQVETLVVCPATPVAAAVRSLVERFRPQLCCLSAVSTQWPVMRAVAAAVRAADRSIFVVLGGHHASLQPEDAIACRDLDAICLGEGEAAAVALAGALEAAAPPAFPGGIPNLWLRRPDGGIERNPPAPFVEDLATIPPIDRSLWLPHVAFPEAMASILLGRGCPNRCTYCSNHAMAQLARGRYVRFRPVTAVLDELAALTAAHPGIDTVYFEVETLGVRLEWTLQLCDALSEVNAARLAAGRAPLRFGSNLALGRHLLAEPRLLDAFQRAGFTFINIGLESGCERIRTEILRRPAYTNAEIVAYCEQLRQRRIQVNLFVLIGIPGETLADWQATVRVARDCRPQFLLASIFHPYPGTDLHQYAVDHGLLASGIDPAAVGLERRSTVLRLPGFTPRQIQREYLLLPWRVFHDRWPKTQVVAQVVKNFLGLHPRLEAGCRALFAASPWLGAVKRRLSAYQNP